MLETKCYTHMPHLPTLSAATVNRCITAEYLPPPKQTPESPIPQGFTYNPKLNETKFVKDLQKEFGRVEAMCMSFPAHTIYNWHTDIFVRVRINYVLNDVGDAYTLFGSSTHIANSTVMFGINECKYTIGHATLFNSKIPHCVINNSDQTRYLLSFRIFDDNVSFDQVEKFLLNYTSDEVL